VIVDDFDVMGMAGFPSEADAPLVVDSNAVLTLAVAFQCFEPVSRWNPKVGQGGCGVDLKQFPERGPVDIARNSSRAIAAEKSLGLRIGEAPNHPL
jgi:hypothetical protein